MAYSWKVLANDWSTLADTDKEALFIGTNYNKPTVAELQALGGKFKIVAYGVDTISPKTVVKYLSVGGKIKCDKDTIIVANKETKQNKK